MKQTDRSLGRMDRRRFMLGAALAMGVPAAGWTAAARGRQVRSLGPGPWRGLRVGMHTYTLRQFNLAQAAAMTRELGLEYIGLNPVHLALDARPGDLRAARASIEGEGLEIMAVGVVQFRPGDPEPERIFDYARAMGMKTIVATPSVEMLDRLDPLVEEFGIKIAIHNHGPGDKWPTPEKLLEAIGDHHASIGACVDMGHYQRAGVDPARAVRLLKDRVYDVHLKDVDRADGRGASVVMGTGVVDVRATLEALIEIGFRGHVALEYEAEARNPMPGCRASLDYVRRCLAPPA